MKKSLSDRQVMKQLWTRTFSIFERDSADAKTVENKNIGQLSISLMDLRNLRTKHSLGIVKRHAADPRATKLLFLEWSERLGNKNPIVYLKFSGEDSGGNFVTQ